MQNNRNTTAGLVPARKNKTPTTGRTVAGADETQNNDLDFLTAARSDKDFSVLYTAFECHGHTLYRTDTADRPVTYWAERLGLVHYLPTIDTARRFLEQIGGRL